MAPILTAREAWPATDLRSPADALLLLWLTLENEEDRGFPRVDHSAAGDRLRGNNEMLIPDVSPPFDVVTDDPDSMIDATRFKCPSCGFTVFNRRVAACESCKAPLPSGVTFTAKDLARLEEEATRIERIRADMAQEAERLEAERRRRQGDGG